VIRLRNLKLFLAKPLPLRKIHFTKGEKPFSRKFGRCYDNRKYNLLMKARKTNIILMEEWNERKTD